MASRRLQGLGEPRDNVNHDAVVNRDQHWKDRFVLHGRHSLAEGYVQGRLYLHLHLLVVIKGSNRESRDWCVGCYRTSEGVDNARSQQVVGGLANIQE